MYQTTHTEPKLKSKSTHPNESLAYLFSYPIECINSICVLIYIRGSHPSTFASSYSLFIRSFYIIPRICCFNSAFGEEFVRAGTMQQGEDIHRRIARISAHLNPSPTNQLQVYILLFEFFTLYCTDRGNSNLLLALLQY